MCLGGGSERDGARLQGFASRQNPVPEKTHARERTVCDTMLRMATATQKHENIRPELKAFITHSIREILDDPDYGLELTEGVKKKLRAAQRSKGRGIPLAEIRKKYY